MSQSPAVRSAFDRTNAIIAAVVYLVAVTVYAMTVQRTFSYWDCGEFIACAHILGIPHPPGTPLFVLLGRLFSMVPFVSDIAHRINFISVLSSGLTAMFSYLLAVRLIRYFFNGGNDEPLHRLIAYAGGVAGAFFVAFSFTNWSNSVEAEVYGMAMAIFVALFWLAVLYHENRGTAFGTKILIFTMYLAMLGIGIHLTVFLAVPIVAVFFLLNKEATPRDYLSICLFAIIELLLVVAFANGRGGSEAFKLVSVLLGAILVYMLWRKISWGLLVAIAVSSAVMLSFNLYFFAVPAGVAVLLIMGFVSKKFGIDLQWKTALVVLLVGFLGFSVHFFIPIRSSLDPRIDENDTSRNWTSFVRFLDRKQYGQVSMVDRMFERRGTWENQFGHHPHMGYWSFFERQYSPPGLGFLPFLALGLIGMWVAIRKRLEIGLPFFTLFLLGSVGLILYMNFADGTMYSPSMPDAYLEVRDRDYFFTPAFVLFGIAMGMGVSAIMVFLKDVIARNKASLQRTVVYASCVLVLLPVVALSQNYFPNDRSRNFLPYYYAKGLLDSCPPNTILFTSGDNDTFPVWCLQEAYSYRKDVRVINLSLLNTDWYIEQMKTENDVPISLDIDQIQWHLVGTRSDGTELWRPLKKFYDRPRKRMTYLQGGYYNDAPIRAADMMVDEIVLQNQFRDPIYFSAPPYSASPLRLRDHCVQVGQVIRLDRDIPKSPIDVDESYHLFTDVYKYDGLKSPNVYRDENATDVALGTGVASDQVYEALMRSGDTTKAVTFAKFLIDHYPEYWRPYLNLAQLYASHDDTVNAVGIVQQLQSTLKELHERNPENYFYLQDYGVAYIELGHLKQDKALINKGIDLMTDAFELNPNSSYTFQKVATALMSERRYTDLKEVARQYAAFKINLQDPFLRSLMNTGGRSGQSPPGQP